MNVKIKNATAGVVIGAIVLFTLGSYILTTWGAMLILGALHHMFGWNTNFSFWESSIVWFISVFLGLLFKR